MYYCVNMKERKLIDFSQVFFLYFELRIASGFGVKGKEMSVNLMDNVLSE